MRYKHTANLWITPGPEEGLHESRDTGPGWREVSAAGKRALSSPGAGVNGKKWPVVLIHPGDKEAEKDTDLFVIIHSGAN